MALWEWMRGKKTYTTACLGVVYALLGYYLEHMDIQQAAEMVFVATGLSTLRHGKSDA